MDRFFVCAHFRAETEQALALAGLDAEITTFPAHCGHPAVEWDSILSELSRSDDFTFILGGCCTTNLDVNQWPDQNIIVQHQEQCFHLFMQPEVVDHYIAKGYHLMTPGWLSGWKNQLEHVMGFDHDSARKCFQETAKKLLLIDTGTGTKSGELLDEMSQYLEIPAERIDVGLAYYSSQLSRLVNDAKADREKTHLDDAIKQQSEYAMVMDLLGGLTDQKDEASIIHALISTFHMLMAPGQCCYFPYQDGEFEQPVCSEESVTVSPDIIQPVDAEYGLVDEDGFWVRISSKEGIFGYIVVKQLAFPQYRHRYLNLALAIRKVAALAINHARDFEKLADMSHEAGKGEVAREVIHNAGNVINSINVTVQHLRSLIEKSATHSLPAIVELMQQHGDALGEFISSDPKGKKIPEYFAQLSKSTRDEQQLWQQQFSLLAEYVGHVSEIIQSHKGALSSDEGLETIVPAKLVNKALAMVADQMDQNSIKPELTLASIPACWLQKHKVLQVLVNLLLNAVEALSTVEGRPRELRVTLDREGNDQLIFEVCDNGPGIPPELATKIFNHGFSSKEGHSGFGLHSSANLAAEMGGQLHCLKPDRGEGVCFRLELPFRPIQTKI